MSGVASGLITLIAAVVSASQQLSNNKLHAQSLVHQMNDLKAQLPEVSQDDPTQHSVLLHLHDHIEVCQLGLQKIARRNRIHAMMKVSKDAAKIALWTAELRTRVDMLKMAITLKMKKQIDLTVQLLTHDRVLLRRSNADRIKQQLRAFSLKQDSSDSEENEDEANHEGEGQHDNTNNNNDKPLSRRSCNMRTLKRESKDLLEGDTRDEKHAQEGQHDDDEDQVDNENGAATEQQLLELLEELNAQVKKKRKKHQKQLSVTQTIRKGSSSASSSSSSNSHTVIHLSVSGSDDDIEGGAAQPPYPPHPPSPLLPPSSIELMRATLPLPPTPPPLPPSALTLTVTAAAAGSATATATAIPTSPQRPLTPIEAVHRRSPTNTSSPPVSPAPTHSVVAMDNLGSPSSSSSLPRPRERSSSPLVSVHTSGIPSQPQYIHSRTASEFCPNTPSSRLTESVATKFRCDMTAAPDFLDGVDNMISFASFPTSGTWITAAKAKEHKGTNFKTWHEGASSYVGKFNDKHVTVCTSMVTLSIGATQCLIAAVCESKKGRIEYAIRTWEVNAKCDKFDKVEESELFSDPLLLERRMSHVCGGSCNSEVERTKIVIMHNQHEWIAWDFTSVPARYWSASIPSKTEGIVNIVVVDVENNIKTTMNSDALPKSYYVVVLTRSGLMHVYQFSRHPSFFSSSPCSSSSSSSSSSISTSLCNVAHVRSIQLTDGAKYIAIAAIPASSSSSSCLFVAVDDHFHAHVFDSRVMKSEELKYGLISSPSLTQHVVTLLTSPCLPDAFVLITRDATMHIFSMKPDGEWAWAQSFTATLPPTPSTATSTFSSFSSSSSSTSSDVNPVNHEKRVDNDMIIHAVSLAQLRIQPDSENKMAAANNNNDNNNSVRVGLIRQTLLSTNQANKRTAHPTTPSVPKFEVEIYSLRCRPSTLKM